MKLFIRSIRRWLFLLLLLSILSSGYAQSVSTASIMLNSDNEVIRNLTYKVDEAGWLYFKESADVTPTKLFIEYKTDIGLGNDDGMHLEGMFLSPDSAKSIKKLKGLHL